MKFIRAFNESQQQFFISAVYGRCDVDKSTRIILFDPFEEAFVCRNEYETDEQGYARYLYDTVKFEQRDYGHFEGAHLLRFKRFAREQGFDADRMSFFQGWPAVLKNKEFLLRIFQDGRVPLNETDMEVRSLEGTDGWTYLSTEAEAVDFLHRVYGFHDGYMEQICYDGASLSLLIDAHQWAGMWVELCFEGCVSANLRPSQEGHPGGALWGCSALDIGNCHVFFALDSAVTEKEDHNHEDNVTWITSIAVKWRETEPKGDKDHAAIG